MIHENKQIVVTLQEDPSTYWHFNLQSDHDQYHINFKTDLEMFAVAKFVQRDLLDLETVN